MKKINLKQIQLKKLNQKNIKIGILVFLLLLGVLFVPVFHRQSLFTKIKKSIDTKIYYDHLSQLRQAAYDSMKVETVTIKNRITGSAPFNSGSVSNADGVDVSPDDDFVRTFDVMKYTVEVGIIPNVDKPGVDSSTVYEGGVIKVRAKLPNQGTPIMMRWEQDAWMQNVTYSIDKTEIYAEYHVPEGVSVTNAVQNLSFTVKVDGYKKGVTSAMAPEFTVWMEGNKEDNSSSSAESVTKKDTRTTTISGKPSYDVVLVSSDHLNLKGTYQTSYGNVTGQFVNYGVGVALQQFDSSIPDLRGVSYPSTDEFTVNYQMGYLYKNETTHGDYQLITDNDPKAYNKINGITIVESGRTGENKDHYYPSSKSWISSSGLVPYGGVAYNKSDDESNTVQESGTVTTAINNDVLSIKFSNYTINGEFPSYYWSSERTQERTIPETTGYFASGNIELFVPYYDDGGASYTYQTNMSLAGYSYKDLSGTLVNATNDANSNNNTLNKQLLNYLRGDLGAYLWCDSINDTDLAMPYWNGNGAVMPGDEFKVYMRTVQGDGPYEGGTDGLLTWNTSIFEPVRCTNNCMELSSSSDLGLPLKPYNNITLSFGVYKSKADTGTTTVEEINSAVYDDFDWYSTYDEATSHGKISALFIQDFENEGNTEKRNYKVRFKALENDNNIGKTGTFRYKTRYYGDENKTEVFYYGGESTYSSASSYIPTIYNEDGSINTYHSTQNFGNTLMIIGLESGVSITTTDLDSEGHSKTSYDVQDSNINLSVTPTLTNHKEASDNDKIVNDVLVKVILPDGLSYVNNSADKTPKSVVSNGDGTTTITWEYDNWQINHDAPEYATINFTAGMNSSIDNNSSLDIQSVIYTNQDKRDEEVFRTSYYGVVISNLAGAKAFTEIDKEAVEHDESFIVTSNIGNNGEEVLSNIRTLSVLPRTNDGSGSKFQGTYTVKFISSFTGQRFFYTTESISESGITEDSYGKLTVKDIDFNTDSRWHEVSMGDVIPSGATAVASVIPVLASHLQESYAMEVTPSDNFGLNTYAFSFNMTSDDLSTALKTNVVSTIVAERRITGSVFFDQNRNGKYDETDERLPGVTVKLLNEASQVISTTVTDQNGSYGFIQLAQGNYYVAFDVPANYEVVPKGDASRVDSEGKSDLITSTNVGSDRIYIEERAMSMGVQKIQSKIVVKYVDADNPSNVLDSKNITKYYGDSYNTDVDSHPTIPSGYEFERKTDNYIGVVQSKLIEVFYYYHTQGSKVGVTLSTDGTKTYDSFDDYVDYNFHIKIKPNNYSGSVTFTLDGDLPAEVDLEKSTLNGATISASDPTSLTWGPLTTTVSGNDDFDETYSVRLYFKNVDPTNDYLITKMTANVELNDGTQKRVESTYETALDIKGSITARFIEIDDSGSEVKALANNETTTKKVGTAYSLAPKKINGYELVDSPIGIIYSTDSQTVVYKYKKKVININIVSDNVGGKITGGEGLFYGDSTKKSPIIVEADPGYQIASIKVNGKEIVLDGVQTKVVLDNIENVDENTTVEASFKKLYDTISAPNTGMGKKVIVMIFGILCIAASIGIYLYTYLPKNKRV